MVTIRKKNWPKDFNLIKTGKKHVQARVADFRIKKGDTLLLEEWNPKTKKYTGRTLRKKVKEVIKFRLSEFGQKRLIERKGLYLIQL